jgi:general secretion pathway protein L
LSTLYLRLPSKAVADSTPNWLGLACPFALVSNGDVSQGGAIEREGVTPLSDLAGTIAKMQRVVLLLAGSDVTVLNMQIPPLSAAKLKTALPNLVEEQLLCDPADCVIVAGGLSDGLRSIAMVQRAWLDLLAKTFTALGARNIAALPAQSCLSGQAGMVTAAIYQRDSGTDLTLRLSEQDGIGLAIDGGSDAAAARGIIQTLCAIVPAAPVTLYVPQAALHAYQEVVNDTHAWEERISVSVDNWTHWIAGARGTAIDLMGGMATNSSHRLDWQAWRWPLALAAAVLLTNVIALNIDWWRMKSEADTLRSSMTRIYRTAYPNESVIIDPYAQMQQKIAIAKRESGLAAPDDFTAMTAAFGAAWASVTAVLPASPSIAALEYRERGLTVRLKGREAPTQQMKAALAERDLSLELAPEQSDAVIWRIRGSK